MSLKAVELQVAVPRTVEHSRQMQIQQHQAILAGAMNAEALADRTERQEQTVTASEENARAELRDRQNGKQRRESGQGKQHDSTKQKKAAPHPYKGRRLDIKM
jgi:hypothetical protein